MDLALNNLQRLICHKTEPTNQQLTLQLWEMWSVSSFPSLPGPLWPGVVLPDMVLSMGQVELFDI